MAVHAPTIASATETDIIAKRQKLEDMNAQQMELYTTTFMQSYYDALQKMQEQQQQQLSKLLNVFRNKETK